MKVNKINIILLFLNNIKSVKLVSYIPDGIFRPQNDQQIMFPKSQTETDLEYSIKNYKDLSELLPSKLLELFISEMKSIEHESTFDIGDNNGSLVHYKLTNGEHLISIKKIYVTDPLYNILPNPIPNTMKYSSDIRYTVLALLYMNNIQSFLVKNADIDSHCPNSNFYIHNNDCLAIDTINSSYYIFTKSNITLMKNRPELSHLFKEEKTTTCCDKFKNFAKDWIPIIHFCITSIAIIISIVNNYNVNYIKN